MLRYVFNESSCCSSPNAFEIYESLDVLCKQLEGWYVREEHYVIFDSEGRRVSLHAEADHLPVFATVEKDPTHRAQLIQLLHAVIEDGDRYGKLFDLESAEWRAYDLNALFELVESRVGTYERNEAHRREVHRRQRAKRLDRLKRIFDVLKFWKKR